MVVGDLLVLVRLVVALAVISGRVGIPRRDDMIGILVLALKLRCTRSIVFLGRFRLGLVVLIGVLVEGGLVVARRRGRG